MKSWYDLTKKEAKKLEDEFLSHEVAREENMAMHLQIILGIFLVIICSSLLFVLIMFDICNIYWFIILFFGLIMGIVIVAMATIEYHIKFNSWLLTKHKIIKK